MKSNWIELSVEDDKLEQRTIPDPYVVIAFAGRQTFVKQDHSVDVEVPGQSRYLHGILPSLNHQASSTYSNDLLCGFLLQIDMAGLGARRTQCCEVAVYLKFHKREGKKMQDHSAAHVKGMCSCLDQSRNTVQ
ncbi:hypothetical protein KCU88_g313, partial [Aureobasidium melanogenum]